MSNIDIISMALRNLLKRKLRTFLTILQVIIGTCPLIIMISLSIAMDTNLRESLGRMGDLLTVNIYNYNSGGRYGSNGVTVFTSDSSSASGELILDDDAIDSFKKIPGVLTATAFEDIYLVARSGKVESWINVRGIDPEAMRLLGYPLKDGTFFTGENKYEVVMGYNAPFDFYNPRDRNREWTYWWPGGDEPVDPRVPPLDIFDDKILFSYDYNFGQKNVMNDPNFKPTKPYTMAVTGWLEYNDAMNYSCFMPIEEVLVLKTEQEKWQNSQWTQPGGTGNKRKWSSGYQNALVKFTDIKYVEDGIDTIKSMGFQANGMVTMLKEIQDMMGSIQLVLGIIGGVALIGSAISIVNTMFMAIYERTREIGIMKVIGATLRDIRRLFLLEAALMGFIGGVFGIGVSLIGSAVINKLGISILQQMTYTNGSGNSPTSVIPFWLCAATLGVTMFMGTLAGFLPARRAMKLSALSAIRME